MEDLRQQVYEALDAALPGRAHFLAPPVDAAEPCLSFFEAENAEAVFADDDTALCEIGYAVDVWARAAGEIPPLAQRADAAMKGLGFTRTGAIDMAPDEFGLHHKSMQYRRTT